jgi:hypothetical protein
VLGAAFAVLAAGGVTNAQAGRGVAGRPEAHPPVVIVSFDELSTASLVGGLGRIDARRYPNFAELARDGNWFPYATASSDETGRSMEALLTGTLPPRGRPPTYGANPRNLFTLLGRRYRIHASEEVTSLCPRRLCPGVHRQTKHSVLHELGGGRPERFARWLRSVRGARRPALFFKHVLLPHSPWRYLPHGRQYTRGDPIPGWGHAFSVPWVAIQKYQRHLLQLAFTDRLLGSLLARLKGQGLYDRALIVVTADNGEGFGRVGNGHEVSAENVGDIALTPLIVKRPFQHDGRVIGRHVRSVDVLPTVARVVHAPIPWRVQGRSVYGPGTGSIPATATVFQRSGRRLRLGPGALRRWARAARRRKAQLFGAGLYAVGPYRMLIGTAPPSPGAGTGGHATLNGARSFHSVHLASGFVPAYVTGRVTGPHPPGAVAVAVNGRIAATSPTYRVHRGGSIYFSALLPEQALREGDNDVRLYAVSGPADGPRLRALGP